MTPTCTLAIIVVLIPAAFAAMPADLNGHWKYQDITRDVDIYGNSATSRMKGCKQFVVSGNNVTGYTNEGGGMSTANLGCGPGGVKFSVYTKFSAVYSSDIVGAILKLTKTKHSISNLSPTTAVCPGAILNGVNWATVLQYSGNKGLNEMALICRLRKNAGGEMLSSCRNGFGGASRRRRAAWADCPKTDPPSAEEKKNEAQCIESPSTWTRDTGPAACGLIKPLEPPISAANRGVELTSISLVCFILAAALLTKQV